MIDKTAASVYFNQANHQVNRGNLAEAIRLYKEALKFNPEDHQVYCNLGDAFSRVEDFVRASECFRKGIALRPDEPISYFNLGNCFAKLNDLTSAIESYQMAIVLNPNYAKAYLNLGTAYESMGDIEEAIACYKKSISADSQNATAHNNLAGIYMEVEGYRDFSKAIELFRTAIRLDPTYSAPYANMGLLFFRRRELENAESYLTKAVELDRKDANSWLTLALICKMQGRDQRAIECLGISAGLGNQTAQDGLNSMGHT